jgi:hypothetical protein
MAKITQYSRISHHTITGSASAVYTIPASEDFTDGTWKVTDLALSEIGINEDAKTAYIRINDEIKEFGWYGSSGGGTGSGSSGSSGTSGTSGSSGTSGQSPAFSTITFNQSTTDPIAIATPGSYERALSYTILNDGIYFITGQLLLGKDAAGTEIGITGRISDGDTASYASSELYLYATTGDDALGSIHMSTIQTLYTGQEVVLEATATVPGAFIFPQVRKNPNAYNSTQLSIFKLG